MAWSPLLRITSLLCGFIGLASAGNILIWQGFESNSRIMRIKPLVEELLRRGHHITWVMPDFGHEELKMMKNATLIQVPREHLDRLVNMLNTEEAFEDLMTPSWSVYKEYTRRYADYVRAMLRADGVAEFLLKPSTFDLTILSSSSLDFGLYYCQGLHNIPTILYSNYRRVSLVDMAIGNPINPSYVPLDDLSSFGSRMTFWERLMNTLSRIMAPGLYDGFMKYTVPLIQEFYGLDEPPNMMELISKIDMAFYNNHIAYEGVQPVNPGSIDIGGLQLRPPQELPKDLKEWIDGAEHGVIILAYGTIVNADSLPQTKAKILLNTIRKLKQRVIMKWEHSLDDMPANLMIKKWLPLQDILGHPNVKLFIHHGGYSSFEESIYHATPSLSMPVAGDQPSNAARLVRLGCGLDLKWKGLTEESFLTKIRELLENKTFQERADYYSSIIKDSYISSLDKAVFYIEYMIRHKGAPFLRSPAKDLYWFQYMLLDVIAFVLAVVSLSFFVVYQLLKLAFRLCKGSKSDVKAKQS